MIPLERRASCSCFTTKGATLDFLLASHLLTQTTIALWTSERFSGVGSVHRCVRRAVVVSAWMVSGSGPMSFRLRIVAASTGTILLLLPGETKTAGWGRPSWLSDPVGSRRWAVVMVTSGWSPPTCLAQAVTPRPCPQARTV